MKMVTDKQMTGLAGEFFVAAELLKRNYQVSVTFGNAKAIDLFVYNDRSDKTYVVQVKTLRAKNCYPIKYKDIKNECVYVFVMLNKPNEPVKYFIVTGAAIKKDPGRFFGTSFDKGSKMPAINYGPLKEYASNWGVFEK